MHELPFEFGDILVFLIAAGFIAPLASRARISPVLTFLIVGLIVGPHVLGRFAETSRVIDVVAVTHVEPVEALAEVGVILLLFLIGLEVSARRLWAMRKLVLGLGGAQVAVSTGAIAGGAVLFGAPPAEAFIVGAALALSSTAIVLELLTERRQLGGPTGQASLSVLLTQDLAVVPLLILIGILGGSSEPSAVGVALAKAAGMAVLAIAVIMLAGRAAARPFLRRVAARRSPEMFVAAVLLLIVLTGAATFQAGLSIALGAFLAGLLLAETEYAHEIEVMLAPFKGLLLGLFFMSVGMKLDPAQVIADPLALLAALGALLVVKAFIVFAAARAVNVAWSASVESALLLAPGGEFAFIALAAAGGLGVVSADVVAFASLVAGASMMLTPLIAAPARRLAAAVERRTHGGRPPTAGVGDLRDHVLVIGYGRVGRLLGELLCEEGIAMVALDADAELVAERRKRGEAVFYGDARHTDILRRLNAETAAAIVITTDQPVAAEGAVRAARQAWPNVPIYARARDAGHAARLVQLGAERVTPEALEASLDLAQAVLAGVGVGEESARSVVDARRRRELDAIAAEGRVGKEA